MKAKTMLLLTVLLLGVLLGREAQAFYNPSTGRWLSRDPIEEKGGLNLFGFVRNEPTGQIDVLGRQFYPFPYPFPRPMPEPPPTQPTLKKVPGKDQLTCCSSDNINQGKARLISAFRTAAQSLSQVCTPQPAGQPGATCKNSSQDLIDWLLPTPPCWVCYLERRNYFPPWLDDENTMTDHQVIICRALSSSGSTDQEIMFDWWGDTNNGQHQSGGSPYAFRQRFKYPDPDQHITEYDSWTDCCWNTRGIKQPKPGFGSSTGH